ncbi:MAG: glycosyltransferase involved in cell wall biosynthesis [Planctomycetota bacterium]|jgi:glycosyltransferase involved in cell wall biosynthesis
MKVLFPVHIYLPAHHAGVELYTAQLASRLRPQVETAVVTTRKVISRETGHINKCSLNDVPLWEVVNNLCNDSIEDTWNHSRMEESFRQVVNEFQPDVVHFQHLMYWSANLAQIARESGAKVFCTLHDFWLMCSRMGQLVDPTGSLCDSPDRERCASCMSLTSYSQPESAKKWVKRLIKIRNLTRIPLDDPMRWAASLRGANHSPAKKPETLPEATEPWLSMFDQRKAAFLDVANHVDQFISPSSDLRRRFIDWGLPGDRFIHLPQGRDASSFADCQQREADGHVRFIFLGTIAPHKGVKELIQAASGVTGKTWSLDVYGPYAQQREYWRELELLAQDHKQITLHGPVDPSALPGIFDRTDVLCVPSLWNECCPLTIQEAFMAGVPVIASDLGGMKELVHDRVGGLRAQVGDIEDWRSKMQSVVDEPELLQSLRATIPQVPAITEHIDELLKIYRA